MHPCGNSVPPKALRKSFGSTRPFGGPIQRFALPPHRADRVPQRGIQLASRGGSHCLCLLPGIELISNSLSAFKPPEQLSGQGGQRIAARVDMDIDVQDI